MKIKLDTTRRFKVEDRVYLSPELPKRMSTKDNDRDFYLTMIGKVQIVTMVEETPYGEQLVGTNITKRAINSGWYIKTSDVTKPSLVRKLII